MSGYYVFHAYDGQAAMELCTVLPNVRLLILNTEGTGVDASWLVREIRRTKPDMAVLHIGEAPIAGMPDDVPNLHEHFTARNSSPRWTPCSPSKAETVAEIDRALIP